MPTSTTDFIMISEIRNRFLKYLVFPPFRYHRFEVLVWLHILMSGTATYCKWASLASSKAPMHGCFSVSNPSISTLHVNLKSKECWNNRVRPALPRSSSVFFFDVGLIK